MIQRSINREKISERTNFMNRKFLAGLLGVCLVFTMALPSFANSKTLRTIMKGARTGTALKDITTDVEQSGNAACSVWRTNFEGRVVGCSGCPTGWTCGPDAAGTRCVCSF